MLAPAVLAHLDTLVARRMRADATPGLALALTDRERTLHLATYGHADLAARTPVAPDHLFELGSIGKTFTALLVLQEAEAGRLDLDAPVTTYLPWFAVRSPHAPITLHHLLSHTAGLTAGMDHTPEARTQVWALRDLEVGGPPGVRFHYSNLGYKILGLVLEAVTRRPYPALLQERILDPLGMAATDPAITHDTRPRLATGYVGLYDDRPFHPGRHPLVPAVWLETDTADGSPALPPEDFAAFARLLVNRGRGPSGPLISEASFERMATSHTPPDAEGNAPDQTYGYGLILFEQDGRPVFGHTGGMVGYLSCLACDPAAGLGVGVLANGPASPCGLANAILALARAALAGDALPPLPPERDRDAVEDAAAFAGSFRDPETGRAIAIEAAGDRLTLLTDGTRVPLTPWDDDAFLVPHPAWDRYLLAFERTDDTPTAATHGPARFDPTASSEAPASSRPRALAPDPDLAPFTGHYRSFSPWVPTFRVVLRRGELRLITPEGFDGVDVDNPLVPLGDPADARFRLGPDPANPETIRFGPILDGAALGAELSGAPYARLGPP